MDKFTRQDLAQCENLVKALKRAKFELDGMEVLAFAETMKWVNSIYNRIVHDVKEEPKSQEVKSVDIKSPEVKPLEVKPSERSKNAKR